MLPYHGPLKVCACVEVFVCGIVCETVVCLYVFVVCVGVFMCHSQVIFQTLTLTTTTTPTLTTTTPTPITIILTITTAANTVTASVSLPSHKRGRLRMMN